jgi:small-conductance mechanosensitive channel
MIPLLSGSLLQVGTPIGEPAGTPRSADTFSAFLPGWIPAWIFQLVLAVAVFAIGYYASTYVRQIVGRRIARRFQRPSVTRTILRSIQTLVVVLSGALALQIVGVPLGNIALSVTVFSAVAGFVLAPIIGSLVNGLFILSEQPYEIGDMIHLSDRDVYGYIEDITLRYTKLFTLDNTFLVIPNGSVRERDVINLSAEDARTRLELDVLVTYESDIDACRELIEQAAAAVDGVIEGGPEIRVGSARYPAKPTCFIETFGDHGVNLRLRYWVAEPYKLLNTRSDIQAKIWERQEDADMEMAYPHSHLYMDETSGTLQLGLGENEEAETLEESADGDGRRLGDAE